MKKLHYILETKMAQINTNEDEKDEIFIKHLISSFHNELIERNV